MKKIIDLRTLLLLLCLFAGTGLWAQNETDFGTWTSVQVNKSWDKPYFFFRGEYRTCRNVSACEAWFINTGGGYKFTPWFKADLSYALWKYPVSGNYTTHKGVLALHATLKRENLSFALREKYELAFTPSAITHTFRTRLRSQYKFDEVPLTPYVMYEPFFCIGKGWVRTLHYIGTEIRIAPHHMIDVFYLYNMYSANSYMNSRHILGLGYYISF